MKFEVESIPSHGIKVFVNHQIIYKYPESLLGDKCIMVLEGTDFEDVERLPLIIGGEITSTFDKPELIKLVECELRRL